GGRGGRAVRRSDGQTVLIPSETRDLSDWERSLARVTRFRDDVTPYSSALARRHTSRACLPGMQVEGGALDQDVELHSEHADRLIALELIHRAELEPGGIDDGDGTGSDHLDSVVRRDECRSVFVESQPDGEGVVRQRRQQPSQPVALAEMLIDDHSIG